MGSVQRKNKPITVDNKPGTSITHGTVQTSPGLSLGLTVPCDLPFIGHSFRKLNILQNVLNMFRGSRP